MFSRGGPKPPETHYVWRPGAPPPRPPRAAWSRTAGVTIAIAVQVGLYLSLRHLATAYMPAWAHHQHHLVAGPLPWPALVAADIVKGNAANTDPAPTLPPFTLSPAPIVVLPAPNIAGNGGVRSD